MKKKILLCSLIVIAIIGVFLISFMFKDTSQYNISLQEESIIVSINPEVLFNTDNKGHVKELYHVNEDAKIYKEKDFLGLEIKEAVNKAIELAKANGYVKEDTVVNVSSLSTKSVYLEDIVLNLKGNKINVKTKKLSKEAIEIIMNNIDTTGNVKTEIIVLDDDYIIIKKEENIVGPGPSEEEINNKDKETNNKPENNNKEENNNNNNNNQNPSNNDNNNNNQNSSNNTTNNDTPTENKPNVEVDQHAGVINLNDNVLYSEGQSAYSCDNCIPDTALSLVKNSKGYYDYNAGAGSNKSYIWWKRIHLSEKYNNYSYKGADQDIPGIVEQAGAIFEGGSYEDPYQLLTEEICNIYKLSCDRW